MPCSLSRAYVFPLVGLMLAGCASTRAGADRRAQDAPELHTVDDLAAYLQSRTLRVIGLLPLASGQRLDSAADTIYELTLEGERGVLYVYQYADAQTAEADSRQLRLGLLERVRTREARPGQGREFAPVRGETPDPRRGLLTLDDAPAFRSGPLIVVYLGRSVAVENLLTEAMGRRIR